MQREPQPQEGEAEEAEAEGASDTAAASPVLRGSRYTAAAQALLADVCRYTRALPEP